MWERRAAGRSLTFHLAGINNQNFLMRDEETGSFWQQISGRAISGPLSGAQLRLVHSDELSFKLWRRESPKGLVLRPVTRLVGRYATKDWEAKLAKARTVLNFPGSGLRSRDLVIGLSINQASRAYPVERVRREQLVQDRLGGQPVLLVLGPDGRSIRAFQSSVPSSQEAPEFYRIARPDSSDLMVDAATGSRWDFRGCAVAGACAGLCLPPLTALKDYWFDWRNYHPATTIFGLR